MTIATNLPTTKGFRSCENKGFHIRFPNGWIVSTQFGAGNYSENYNLLFDEAVRRNKPDLESEDAEIWCWNPDAEEQYPESPLANQSPAQLLKLLNKISKKRRVRRTK
jgi:hypothetical protein